MENKKTWKANLNNQKSNLRIATRAENMRNRSKYKTGSSQYKGVNRVKKSGAWRANISIDKKLVVLGYFSSEKTAAKTYNNAALKYYGEFANINLIL